MATPMTPLKGAIISSHDNLAGVWKPLIWAEAPCMHDRGCLQNLIFIVATRSINPDATIAPRDRLGFA
jgi:hypothetical protein